MLQIINDDNGMKIGAGYLPDLKKPCLVIYKSKNVIHKVATFNTEESCVEFMNYLAKMMGAKNETCSR